MKLLVESSDVLPLVDIEIAFRTGSLRDPVGKEGLAQLSGHLMRRGPRGLSQARFEERVASMGARVSVEVSMRTTRVRATVLRRSLEPLLALLAKMIWRPALRQDDFEKLRRQAQAGLAARLDDDQTLGAVRFRKTLFANHPYSRTLGGTRASLGRLTVEDARRFYRRELQNRDFVIGIAGDVERHEAEGLVARHLAPRRSNQRPHADVPPTRLRRGRHVVIVDKPQRHQTQLFIGTLGARTRDRHLFPLIVSNTAFGGTFSGPLMQEVRASRGWSYGAYSRLLHSTARDAWYMWTAPAAEYSADCAALQLELLERWVDRGIPKTEHRFAQKYLINGHCFDRDTPSKRLEAQLDVELLGVPKRYVDRYDAMVERVTLTEAHEATRRRISPRDLTIVVVATASEVEAAFSALPGVSSVEVVAFDGE